MIAVRGSGPERQSLESALIEKRLVITLGNRLAALNPDRQFAKLRDAQRALDIGEPEVVTEFHHLVEPGPLLFALAKIRRDAVAAKYPQARGEIIIVCRHHAAFPGRDRLHGMQAERAHVRLRTSRPPLLVESAQGMTGIRHQPQSVFFRDGPQT